MNPNPKDAWIHVDLTADAASPVLLQNAAVPLAPGGILVLSFGKNFPYSRTGSVTVTLDNVRPHAGAPGEEQIVVFRQHAPAA